MVELSGVERLGKGQVEKIVGSSKDTAVFVKVFFKMRTFAKPYKRPSFTLAFVHYFSSAIRSY